MPPPVVVAGDVREIRASRAQFPLQGETPHQRDLGQIPHWQSSPKEQPLEEIHVRLYPEEGLADSNKAYDVQHPHRIEVLQLQTPLI